MFQENWKANNERVFKEIFEGIPNGNTDVIHKGIVKEYFDEIAKRNPNEFFA